MFKMSVKSHFLPALAVISALSLSVPSMASAYDNCKERRSDNQTAGAIVGAVAGAAAGNQVASRNDKKTGMVVGALLGAVVGSSVAGNNTKCYTNNRGYYDRRDDDYRNGNGRGYYDNDRRYYDNGRGRYDDRDHRDYRRH